MRILQFLAFILVFFSIYGSTNAYVIWRINNLLGNKFTKLTLLLVLFATSSYILGVLAERLSHNILTRSFYAITATWMGVLLLLFSALLIFEIINYFYKLPPKTSLYSILFIVGALSAYSIFNALNVKIKEVTIPIQNLEKEVRIVQLTDLHVGTIKNSKFLDEIVTKTNSLNPDFVAITGDLVDGSGPLRPGTYEKLNEIEAETYFVTGNHEIYEQVSSVLKIFEDIDAKILMNENVETKGIQVIGLNFTERNKETEQAFTTIKIDPEKPSVLLAHNPNAIYVASKKGIDLQLAGHTHNGQIIPFNLLVKLFYPYIQGLYNHEGSYLYVSPGTSTWGPPMRLGSNNEITLLRLVPQN